VLSTRVSLTSDRPYVTVVASADRNGVEILSRHDNGFTAKFRKYSSHNVLFLGDSITYGSPYKGKTTKEIFSYPSRVGQLTGVRYYNPSIPGSTYAYRPYSGKGYHRYRIVRDIAERISQGRDPVGPEGLLHSNTQTFKDFDTIVMAAGTNDYTDNIKLGSLNSRNIHEFNGAVNRIFSYIKEGNKERVAEGKKPAKIILMKLFYSDRTVPPYGIIHDRFITKNELGLTLTDYQQDLYKLIKKYKREGLDVYQFDTSSFVTKASCPYATSDNLHMTRFTYSQIGNSLSAYLMKHVF